MGLINKGHYMMRWNSRVVVIGTVVLMMLLTSVVFAMPPQQANLFQLFQLNIRRDLETLADQVYGEGERPDTWTGNEDLEAVNFSADIWFDNEQLADAVFGQSVRPDEWFGATTNLPEIVARNVRHDLELTATEFFEIGARPPEWNGAARVFECSRTLQNLLTLLDQEFEVRSDTPDSVVNYCQVVQLEIEDELFNRVLGGADFQVEVPELISGLRGDLERLADELLGLDTRPQGWTGNREDDSETFTVDIFTDLALLADDRLGEGNRPDGWIGVITTSPAATYRNLRFDLELLADLTLPPIIGEGNRPNGWQGVDPAATCTTTVQNLTLFVEFLYGVSAPTLDSVGGDKEALCNEITLFANSIAENPPEPEEGVAELDRRYIYQSRLAFSYLDVEALEYMGVMPWDVEFRAWYRNFQESNMMFVSGPDFALFIDRRWTTMPEEIFIRLPTLEGRRPLTFCDASWCNGPGPTPTPTGVGPIAAVLQAATIQPTPDAADLENVQQKVLVSWNNIRVSYLLDKPQNGTVQVTLEICADPSQIACEPVISIFDGNTGTFKAAIQTFNGLNVYELPYGYLTNIIIEGDSRFSQDVWISDPTIR